MPVDLQLLSAEDSLKEKHLGIVKQMSYVDLKKFSTGKQFKQSLIDELTELLPEHPTSDLTQTAQCISNAVYREAKSLLNKKPREAQTVNTSTDNPLLSETVLQDFDTTMQPDVDVENECVQLNESETIETGDCEVDDENHSDPCADPTVECLDDSITKLKQKVESGNKPPQSICESKDETKSNKKDNKCCDTCKVKPTYKKKYDMIQCSACMIWYHETCVGISKNEPVGLWFCPACRCIPPTLATGIKSLKDDVDSLKQTTLSILTTVQGLSTSIGNSIENLNDRITALQRQINAKDLCITEKLESLSNTTDNIKTVYDQKACKLINKTTAIFDKVKEQSETIKTISEKCKQNLVPCIDKNVPKQQADLNKTSDTSTQHRKPNGKRPNQNDKPPKPQTPNEPKQKRFQKPKAAPYDTRESEPIDLTNDSRKTIKESTLLVGSSILKGVKTRDLKPNTTVRSFRGATMQTLKSKLQQYDIENCTTIILHVGGNDADDSMDLESFQDNYIDLMDSLASDDRRLIVSGLLPRASVDLEPYNKQLKLLCDENHIDFIDHYDSFLLASGELPATYYHSDKTHLNVAGTRKLLHNVDRRCKVTGPTGSSKAEPQRHRPRRIAPSEGRFQSLPTFCHICSMRNHNTYECYFNSRRAGMAGRKAH